MRTARSLAFLAFLSILLFFTVGGPHGGAGAQGAAALDPTLLGPLRWRNIGPANTGGRIDDFAVARVPGQPDAIYVATASGGVFKSVNGGVSWAPVFDKVDG